MPNRILREGILTSERINTLDWPAEVFYRRLMSAVDDFGRYYAKPELLRAVLYPLQLDKVGNSDIGKWLLATRKAALVRTYAVDGKEYLELVDFRQHRRAAASKFPRPPDECSADALQMQCNSSADEHVVVCEGVCVNGTTLSGKPDPLAQAREVLDYLNRNANRAYRPSPANLNLIRARLKSGVSVLQMKEVVRAKCEQWGKDAKMMEYLRPKTLFNATNFENYLGDLTTEGSGGMS